MIAGSTFGDDVIFTMHPLLTTNHRERITELMFAVAEQLHDTSGRRLLIDDFDSSTKERAARIRATDTAVSTVAYVAADSFGVEDAKVIQNIDEQLETAGIRVEHVRADGPIANTDEGAAIVITGHSAPELRNFIRHLALKGAFTGKTVIVNSCGTPLTRELAHEIVLGGAIGVFHFEGAITAPQVRRFMLEVGKVRSSGDGSRLPAVIERSVKPLGMRGLWQISRLDRPQTDGMISTRGPSRTRVLHVG